MDESQYLDTPVLERPVDLQNSSLPVQINDIRSGIIELATSDSLDKAAALQITRLFHGMEMLLRHECNTRDTLLRDTQNEVERLKLQTELDRLSNRHHIVPEEASILSRSKSSRKW